MDVERQFVHFEESVTCRAGGLPGRRRIDLFRRRRDLALGVDVYEIKLDDKYLMSSLFTAAEVELARLALRALPDCEADVLVGGLGLGYTAQAVLEHERLRSVVVVEALAEVISWHQRGLRQWARASPLTHVTAHPRRLLCNARLR